MAYQGVCQIHGENFVSICTAQHCQHECRLQCIECMYDHNCHRRMKLENFITSLHHIISEVDFEQLEMAYDQNLHLFEWKSFVDQAISYMHEALNHLAKRTQEKVFSLSQTLVSTKSLNQLRCMIQDSQDLNEIDNDTFEVGITFLSHQGKIQHQLELLELQKEKSIKQIQQMKEEIRQQIIIFVRNSEDITDKIITPTDFEQFKTLKEQKIVVDKFGFTKLDKALPLTPNQISTLGQNGELILWNVPLYEYQGRINVKNGEQPLQVLTHTIQDFNVIIAGTVDKLKKDSIMIWEVKHPQPLLVYHEVPYPINTIIVQGEFLYTCDYQKVIFIYRLQVMDNILSLLKVNEICLHSLQSYKVISAMDKIVNMVVLNSANLLIQLQTQIMVINPFRREEVHSIQEYQEIQGLISLEHDQFLYSTSKCALKVYNVKLRRHVRDFETPHKSINFLTYIHSDIIAFVADKFHILIQRINDGSFIKISTGIVYPLTSLTWNKFTSNIMACDTYGRLQVWGYQTSFTDDQ